MRKNRGLTLAEIMIAFLILVVAALFILALFMAGLGHYRHLDVVTTVDSLQQQLMDETMATPFAVLASRAGSFAAPFQDYSYDLDITTFSGTTERVSLTVTGPGGTSRSMEGLRAPSALDPGMLVFIKHDCWTCHSNSTMPVPYDSPGLTTAPQLNPPGIVWTATQRLTDPTLNALIAAELGHPPTAEDYIKVSIRESQLYHVPGYAPSDPGMVGNEMPHFDSALMPDAELEPLVDYLMTLDTPGP